jgi:hypothetical protein
VKLFLPSILPHTIGGKTHGQNVSGAIAAGSRQGKRPNAYGVELIPQHGKSAGHLSALSGCKTVKVSQKGMLGWLGRATSE